MTESGPPAFYAAPELAGTLGEGARGVVFLVGAYDGAGDFGDVLELEAAARLVEMTPQLAPVAVLELENEPRHREIAAALPAGSVLHRVVYAAPGWLGLEATEDSGLVPATLPGAIERVAVHLYGGSYLDSSGERRSVELVEAVGAFAEAAGVPVEPVTASGNGGDDTLRLLAEVVGDADPGAPGPLRLNLHLSVGSSAPEQQLPELAAGLVDRVAERVPRAVQVQPVIACDDARADDRVAIRRFMDLRVDGRRPITVSRGLLLRGSVLADCARTLRRGAVTVTCSYHVALISLLAGVPAVLLAATDRSRQAGEGLRELFEAPGFAILDQAESVEAAWESILGAAVVSPRRSAVADALRAGRAEALQRRESLDRRLSDELGAMLAAGAEPMPETARRLARVREARNALLIEREQARAAIQRLEREFGRPAAELAALRGSTSWRITAPIRRLHDAGRSLLRAALGISDRGSGGPVVRAIGRLAWRLWHTWARLRQRRRS